METMLPTACEVGVISLVYPWFETRIPEINMLRDLGVVMRKYTL
jgi:hypothetical protein